MEKHVPGKSYRIKEVAEILNLHPETIRGLVRDGKLLAYKPLEHEWRVEASDLRKFQDERKEKVVKPAFEEVMEFKSNPQNLLKGGQMMKVKKVGQNRWFAGFGGFYWKKDSKGFKRWYIWWYDERDKRKFKCVKTDDSKLSSKVKITRGWPQVTNEKEGFIALIAELERARMEAFAKKVARYNPDQGKQLMETLGIEENENGDVIKLSKLMENWLENHARLNHVDKGKSAESAVKYWGEKFGKKKAVEITRGEIQRHFIAEQKEALSAGRDLNKIKATQKQRGTILMGIYNWAIEKMGDYGVKVNPVVGTLPKPESKEKEAFTRNELQSLFQKASEFYIHMLEPMAYALITGGRIGELENLRWENVNLEEGYVKIMKPKEKNSKKIDIDADCALYQMFVELKKKQENLDERDFKNGDYGQVFIYWNPRYDKWGRTPIADHFLEIRREVGIENKSFHSFRHTAGSIGVSNGANVRAIQAIYGHSTVDMTQHYLHASREDKVDVVKIIEKQVNIGNLLNGNGAKIACLPQGN